MSKRKRKSGSPSPRKRAPAKRQAKAIVSDFGMLHLGPYSDINPLGDLCTDETGRSLVDVDECRRLYLNMVMSGEDPWGIFVTREDSSMLTELYRFEDDGPVQCLCGCGLVLTRNAPLHEAIVHLVARMEGSHPPSDDEFLVVSMFPTRRGGTMIGCKNVSIMPFCPECGDTMTMANAHAC